MEHQENIFDMRRLEGIDSEKRKHTHFAFQKDEQTEIQKMLKQGLVNIHKFRLTWTLVKE